MRGSRTLLFGVSESRFSHIHRYINLRRPSDIIYPGVDLSPVLNEGRTDASYHRIPLAPKAWFFPWTILTQRLITDYSNSQIPGKAIDSKGKKKVRPELSARPLRD
jgi:hypothetical protein